MMAVPELKTHWRLGKCGGRGREAVPNMPEN